MKVKSNHGSPQAQEQLRAQTGTDRNRQGTGSRLLAVDDGLSVISPRNIGHTQKEYTETLSLLRILYYLQPTSKGTDREGGLWSVASRQ